MTKTKINIDLIKHRLVELNKTQKDLAVELAISEPAVSKWLSGKSNPEPTYLKKLCEILTIPFSKIIEREQRFCFQFRLNKTKKKNVKDDSSANEIISALTNLLPIIEDGHKFLNKPLSLVNIENNEVYYNALTASIKQRIGKLSIHSILQFICESFNIIIVPVLWGDASNFCNALEITDNKTKISFLYINLNSKKNDFRFWLLHEIFHILGFEDDGVADLLAGKVLFPEHSAITLFNELHNLSKKQQVSKILEMSKQLEISNYTVYKTLQNISKNKKDITLSLVPYSDIAVLNKSKNDSYFLAEHEISAQEYIKKSKTEFGSNFFDYVSEYITSNNDVTPHFIRRLLNLSMSDSIEVFKVLKNG